MCVCVCVCVCVFLGIADDIATCSFTFFPLFQEPSLYSIKALAILDNDGNRLLAKVHDF